MFKTGTKRWLVSIAGILATSATAFAGVAISAPANNATINGPIPVVASATAPGRAITAMAFTPDNNLLFKVTAATVNTKVNAGPGPHMLVVQAWDSANAVYKPPVPAPAGGTAGPATAAAPSAAAMHTAIQTMPGWESCDV